MLGVHSLKLATVGSFYCWGCWYPKYTGKGLGEGQLELLRNRAVDEKIRGEVEHDHEMSYRLCAHNPEGRDVVVHVGYAGYLHI